MGEAIFQLVVLRPGADTCSGVVTLGLLLNVCFCVRSLSIVVGLNANYGI